jgi:hypothetical protein
MAAPTYNFEIEQGTTVVKVLQYTDSSGNPIPLTGYVARMQMRPTVGSLIKYLDLGTVGPLTGIVITAATGIITITISAALSATIPTDGVYDLEIESPAGVVTRLLQGSITISQEVTR